MVENWFTYAICAKSIYVSRLERKMTSATLLGIERQLHLDAARLAPEFAAFSGTDVTLQPAAFHRPALLGFFLRHALESAWLTEHGAAPALAALAAARAGAQFLQAEA